MGGVGERAVNAVDLRAEWKDTGKANSLSLGILKNPLFEMGH